MKIIKLFAFLFLSGSVWAQKEISLPDFKKIEVDVPVKIHILNGSSCKSVVPKSLSGLSFSVDENGVLLIKPEGDFKSSSEYISLFCSGLNQIHMNGAGEIKMEDGNTLKGESFELTCEGATQANLSLKVNKLKVTGNGASKITLSGSSEKTEVDLSSAAKLFASDLMSKDLKIVAAGASHFNVNASENLDIDAAGATTGVYTGNPSNKKINLNGLANIVDANTGENMKDERNGGDDTTRITLGKKKVIIIEEDKDENKDEDDNESRGKHYGHEKQGKKYDLKKVYAGFELGMNQLISPNLNFSMPAGYNFLECKMEKSWFYGLNLLEGDMQLVKNKLAITSGLGMEFQNFQFNTDQVITPNVNTVQADSGLIALSGNKMYNYNINAPLLIKFAPRTRKSKNNFHFAVGVIGSFKAYSHLKTETTAAGYKESNKMKDDFNINPFRLTATARVGYGWFRAFVNYSLTPYFNTNNGNPDVRVFAAGLTLVPF